MKSDLDCFMQSSGIDALLVTGPAAYNPVMVYFTGVAHVSQADMIKRCGHPGVLFHASMERDEAAKSGLELRSYSNYPMMDLLRESGNDRKKSIVLRYKHMLTDAGVSSGRVALYGQTDLGEGYAQFKNLQEAMPAIEFVGDLDEDVVMSAMATKDGDEIERIRRMGEVTTRVVGSVADFLSSRPIKNGALVGPDGDLLTIGEVKNRIKLWLAEGGAEDPEGTIFSIGMMLAYPTALGTLRT
jgi:Xaa-Pro aminopeptidase